MIFNRLLTIFNLVMTYELDTYIIWGGGGGGQPQKTHSFSKIAKWVFLTLVFIWVFWG